VEQSVARRRTCDRRIWRKPLAFAADAEGYKYIVWVFNGRFAISSPELCRLPSFVEKESLGTPACYHSAQKNLASAKTAGFEHAVASAAPAASSKSLLHFKTHLRVFHQPRSLESPSLRLRTGRCHYRERFVRFRFRAYSSMRRSYSRYVEAFTGSRRLILSMMRLPNPCRITFRIPIFLTNWLRERLGCVSGSRDARLALRVYSIGV